MANYTIDPNTGNLIPTPGVDPGPDYAVNVSNSLLKLGSLTHTGAANNDGLQIPSAGLNINADLSAQSNNLTTLRSTRFSAQSSVLTGSGDVGCLYDINGDCWWNNGSGTPIQLTSGSNINFSYPLSFNEQIVTASTVIASSNTKNYLNVQLSSAAVTITLPVAAAVADGRFFYISDTNGLSATHNITVSATGSDTLNGNSSYVVLENWTTVAIVSDGVSKWNVLPYNRKVYSGETISLSNTSSFTTDSTSTCILDGAVTMNSTLGVGSTLAVGGAVTFSSTLGVTSTLLVDGVTTLSGGLILNYPAGFASPTIDQLTQTSNIPANNLTIQAQGAYASALTSNRVSGSINLNVKAPTNGGTTYSSINLQNAGTNFLTFTSDSSTDALIAAPAGGIVITSEGSTILTLTPSAIGFYSTGPTTQATAIGGISDFTGGTASSTFAGITAGVSYAQADMVSCKNALAETAVQLNKINTILHNIGITA